MQVTGDEHVDVAADVVVATRVRAEHERVVHTCFALENRAQLGDETDGSCIEVAEGRIQGIRRIHPPHAQRTDAPTLDEPLPEQFLKRELYRPRTAVDPPYEIACMELLARRTRQQREQASLGRRTLDIGHGVMIHPYQIVIRMYFPPCSIRRATTSGSRRDVYDVLRHLLRCLDTSHSSPEGIRTPDLFLEREEDERSVLATKTLKNDAPDRPERASEKRPRRNRREGGAQTSLFRACDKGDVNHSIAQPFKSPTESRATRRGPRGFE